MRYTIYLPYGTLMILNNISHKLWRLCHYFCGALRVPDRETQLKNTNTYAFRVLPLLISYLHYPLIDRQVAEMRINPDINSLPGNS